MKKADKMLLAVITLSAVVFLLGGLLRVVFGHTAEYVTVYEENKKVGEYSLKEDGVYDIKTEYGYNQLTVRDGEAYVSLSDCPGGDCMKMRADGRGGSIICLPHHLVIKAVAGDTEGTDAVAR